MNQGTASGRRRPQRMLQPGQDRGTIDGVPSKTAVGAQNLAADMVRGGAKLRTEKPLLVSKPEAPDLASRRRDGMARTPRMSPARPVAPAKPVGAGMGNPAANQPSREAEKPLALVKKPNYGFERFLEKGINMSGGRYLEGKGKKAGGRFSDGPFKGMTKGQAYEKARSMYANMSPEERARYEQGADMGDVRSETEVLETQKHEENRQAALNRMGMAF